MPAKQERFEKTELGKQLKQKRKNKASEDRKIHQYVFDHQTLFAVTKLINKSVITGLKGIISTGKEANVFSAETKEGNTVAVKIYKLETSSFHSMRKYVEGDPRFHKIKRNRRNLIYEWSKKEYRNLKRCHDAKIRVPKPLAQEKNVLIMEYIEDNGKPAPPLRNVNVKKPEKLLEEITEYIAKMFYTAKLVHADLSEYNILYSKNHAVIIDMGQGVLLSHPDAKEYFERDLSKITRFFNNLGVPISTEELKQKIKTWEPKLKKLKNKATK